jgi:hypothetical protein
MKALLRPLRAKDVDVGRQKVVELARELQRIDRLVRTEVGDLRYGVDPRIRAAGAADVDVAEDLRGGA